MTQRKKLLVALIGVSATSFAIGTGVFAATTRASFPPPKLDCLDKEFYARSGTLQSHPLESFFSQLSLSTSEKDQLDLLLTELKSARNSYQEAEKSAKNEEEQAALKAQREKKKSEIKLQILALLPQEQKAQFEQFLSKPKGDRPFNKKWSKPKSWNSLGFLWTFLDENQLSDAQKSEIQLLQQQKSAQMDKLLEQMRSPSNLAQKEEIEAQLQKVNQDFLTGLKKYISSDKVAEYEKFIAEIQFWNKKAEKRPQYPLNSELSSKKGQKELSTTL